MVGLLVGAGLVALQRFLLDVARGEALLSVFEDFPDQADLIETVALVLAAHRHPAAAVDGLARHRRVVRPVLDDRAPGCGRPSPPAAARRALPRLLRPLARRDRFALFIAIDDGRSDRVSAWLSNERTAVPQGARARVLATPVLGYVRSSEPIGTTR